MLEEIKRLKELNQQVMIEAMLKGNRTAIDYSNGFDDALTNMEWFVHAENHSKKEHIREEMKNEKY